MHGFSVFLVAALVLPAPWDRTVLSHVRPCHDALRSLMTDGYRRCDRFRELVNRLEEAPVIVLVRIGRCDARVPACLHLLGSNGTIRALRVTVNGFAHTGAPLLGLVAHELQHAYEIAQTAAVRDPASLKAFYTAHGKATEDGFETEAARQVERAVLRALAERPR